MLALSTICLIDVLFPFVVYKYRRQFGKMYWMARLTVLVFLLASPLLLFMLLRESEDMALAPLLMLLVFEIPVYGIILLANVLSSASAKLQSGADQ
jgi:hypothetical protein